MRNTTANAMLSRGITLFSMFSWACAFSMATLVNSISSFSSMSNLEENNYMLLFNCLLFYYFSRFQKMAHPSTYFRSSSFIVFDLDFG